MVNCKAGTVNTQHEPGASYRVRNEENPRRKHPPNTHITVSYVKEGTRMPVKTVVPVIKARTI